MNMRISGMQIITASLTIIITFFGYYTFDFVRLKLQPHPQESFFFQGFDFRLLHSLDKDLGKISFDDRVAVKRIQTIDGRSILETTDRPLLLIVVLDPACEFCEISKDIMTQLQLDTHDSNISYFPAVFTTSPAVTNLSEYSMSMGFSEVFTWESTSIPPKLLLQMPTPAHLLIDRKGKIIRTWFSSSRDPLVRKRMSSQIAADLSLIEDIYPILNEPNQD